MNTYEVIIVGAGPSGIVAGITLLRNNVKCLIIDKCELPRFKLCGGLITSKAITHLRLQGFNHIDDILLNSSKIITLEKKNEHMADLECTEPVYFVHRPTFDKVLLDRFLKLGGEFLKEIVTTIDTKKREIVLGNKEIIPYKYLIGADGVEGIVQTYVRNSKIQYAKGCGVVISKSKIDFDNSRVKLNFGHFHDGFLCEYPKGDTITIGCLCSEVRHDALNLKKYLAEWLKTKYQYKVKEDEIHESRVPYGWHCTEITNSQGNIFLVGDAGGYATCIPGDGIYGGIISGELAATAILSSRTKNEHATTLYQQFMAVHIKHNNNMFNNIRFFYDWNDVILHRIKKNKGVYASFFYDVQIAYNTCDFNIIKLWLAWRKAKLSYMKKKI